MGNGQDNVIIRLRGHGETERLLQFDHANVSSTNADTRTGWQINRAIVPEIGKVGYGWITLGYYESSSYSLLTDLKKAIKYENNLTLQIEKNITLDGEGRTLPQGQQQRLRVFISFNKRNATFIMEEGSKITRAKIRSDGQSTIEDHNGINTTFWMKGGTITDNQSYNNDPSVRYGFIKMSLLTQDGTGIFKKTGGSFINNLHNKFYSGNQVVPLVSENHYYITKDTISLYNPES